MNGWSAIKGYRGGEDGKIIIFSIPDSNNQMLDKILSAIETDISVEEHYILPDRIMVCDLEICLKEQRVYQDHKYIPLSHHEYFTLLFLAKHLDWVCSKEQIYRAVWKEEPIDCDNSIMCCISQIRRKLGENPKGQSYIETVRGVGYRLRT